jgi:hypothetical protein
MLRDYLYRGKTQVPSASYSFVDTGKSRGMLWRDYFDVAVKWRQWSEPNDPVFYVDLLTPEQFAQGFGGETAMVAGQSMVVRYSPSLPLSWPLFIREILVQRATHLTEADKTKIKNAKTLDDVYAVMKANFDIVTPAYSNRSGQVLEGTRLTLLRNEPEGFDYMIRTPSTPIRWLAYHMEIDHMFKMVLKEAKNPVQDINRTAEVVLTLAYYWYNFMPIARGTAATGYVSIIGTFLAFGYKIDSLIPIGHLPDWEAILRSHPNEFIDQLRPWMIKNLKKIDLKEFDALPRVKEVFPTLRDKIMALNADW